jgi:RNA-directed DNA polymerase
VALAQEYIADGYSWCIDFDFEKFFDRVNHDELMGQVLLCQNLLVVARLTWQ